MNKICYICGQEIKSHDFYYCVGPHSYVCNDKNCYQTYFWDRLAAKFVTDNKYQYVVINGILYQIDDDKREPKGFSGMHHTIQFENGKVIETNSLWLIGEVPETKRNIFKDNAHFVQKG